MNHCSNDNNNTNNTNITNTTTINNNDNDNDNDTNDTTTTTTNNNAINHLLIQYINILYDNTISYYYYSSSSYYYSHVPAYGRWTTLQHTRDKQHKPNLNK